MSEKIGIQEIINFIAERRGIAKKDAEFFFKTMLGLIEEALEKEQIIKLKGLGTFKLIRVDSRESVDVNTGERFLIEGHTKVSFTPEASVRDLINKPFSHFETVILNENTVFEDTEEIDNAIEEKNINSEKESVTITRQVENSENIIITNIKKEEYVFIENDSPENETTPTISSSDEIITDNDVVTEKEEKIDEQIKQEPQIPIIAVELNPVSETIGDSNATTSTLDKPVSSDDTIKEEDKQIQAIPNQNTNSDVESSDDETDEKKEDIDKPTETSSKSRLEVLKEEIENENLTNELRIEKAIDENVAEGEANVVGFNTLKKANLVEEKGRTNKLVSYIVIIIITLFMVSSVIFYIYRPDVVSDLLVKDASTKESVENSTTDKTYDKSATKVEYGKSANENEANDEISGQEKLKRLRTQRLIADTTKTIVSGLRQGYDNVIPDSVSYVIVGTMTEHVIENGETLTKVSYRFYGTKDLWPYLVMHNRNIIKRADNVPVGTKIRIPTLRDKSN